MAPIAGTTERPGPASSSRGASVNPLKPLKKKSRAVQRRIEAGNTAACAHCAQPVKFAARVLRYQVICNVYVKGRWDRVEHFHDDCYREAGAPYGPPVDGMPERAPSNVARRSA